MSRLIDADELLKKTKHWKEDIITDEILFGMVEAFEIGILETKTADAEEVVRCKDCGFFSNKPGEYLSHTCGHPLGCIECDETTFCSYGERRADE